MDEHNPVPIFHPVTRKKYSKKEAKYSENRLLRSAIIAENIFEDNSKNLSKPLENCQKFDEELRKRFEDISKDYEKNSSRPKTCPYGRGGLTARNLQENSDDHDQVRFNNAFFNSVSCYRDATSLVEPNLTPDKGGKTSNLVSYTLDPVAKIREVEKMPQNRLDSIEKMPQNRFYSAEKEKKVGDSNFESKTNVRFSTTAMDYGKFPRGQEFFGRPADCHSLNTKFTKKLAESGMFQNNSLNS